MPQSRGIASLAESASSSITGALGQAPAIAMGMTYVAGADSIGIAMANAVATQQRGQVLAGAALSQVLALIIAKGASGK